MNRLVRTKFIRLALLIAVSLAGFAASAQAVRTTESTGFSRQASDFLDAWERTGRFWGAVLVAAEGEVLFEAAYGLADVTADEPNRPDTRYRLGSLSKQFTAAAVLRLVEEGRVALDHPVSDYLPDFPGGAAITVQHLLTHTSGLADYSRTPEHLAQMATASELEALLEMIGRLPPHFPAGRDYAYSNSNYVVLTAIVERVTGQGMGDFLEADFFAPLGMEHTSYLDRGSGTTQLASGHIFTGGDYVPATPIDLTRTAGAGGVTSSADDLLRWTRALFGGEVLGPEMLAQMLRPQAAVDAASGLSYGYGWYLGERWGQQWIGHDGGINGFRSQLLHFTADELTVIVLSNIDAAPAPEIAYGLAALYLGEPVETPVYRESVELSSERLARYVGRYQLPNGVVAQVVAEQGHLYLDNPGSLRFELFASGPGEFFLRNVDLDVSFVEGESGNITGMLLRQGAGVLPAVKLP